METMGCQNNLRCAEKSTDRSHTYGYKRVRIGMRQTVTAKSKQLEKQYCHRLYVIITNLIFTGIAWLYKSQKNRSREKQT